MYPYIIINKTTFLNCKNIKETSDKIYEIVIQNRIADNHTLFCIVFKRLYFMYTSYLKYQYVNTRL